jgi:hypothetical protein
MKEPTTHCYADAERAKAHATLPNPGTHHLAFRDLPELLLKHTHGRKALDFGCGAGRSTRLLRAQGFQTCGIDDTAEYGDAVSFVDVEQHDSGAWLVYQYMGLNAETQPPPMAVRLNATGGEQAGPVSLDEASGRVAIARMGNRFAVGWLGPQGAPMELRLLGEDLSVAASYSLEVGPGMPHGVPSLIGSTSLLSWLACPSNPLTAPPSCRAAVHMGIRGNHDERAQVARAESATTCRRSQRRRIYRSHVRP